MLRWDGRKYTYTECNGGKPHLTLMGVMKASPRKGHLGGDQEAGKEEVFQAVGGMDKGLRESERQQAQGAKRNCKV